MRYKGGDLFLFAFLIGAVLQLAEIACWTVMYEAYGITAWYSEGKAFIFGTLFLLLAMFVANDVGLIMTAILNRIRTRRDTNALLVERDSLVTKLQACVAVPTSAYYRTALIDSSPAAKRYQIDHVSPDLQDDLDRLETVEKMITRTK